MSWRNPKTRASALEALANEKIIILFDTETTGLKDEDEIIELAAKKFAIEGTSLKEIGVFHEYFKPPFAISEKITEITGITNDFLEDKPSWHDKIGEITEFFSDHCIVCYNTPFDLNMMQNAYKREGIEYAPKNTLDVLEMAKDCVAKGATENHKLGTIASHYGVDFGLSFHNALDDVTATERLFNIFIEEYKEQKEDESYKICPILSRVAFWEGFRGFSRIYVETNYGSVYYDIRRKSWDTKDAPIEKLDMVFVEKSAWALVDASTEQEFARFRGSVKA